MVEINPVLRISGGQRRSFTVIDWCVTACVFAPFIIKRLVVLGEHDYVYWIAVDYAARLVSLVGLALAYRRGLMMPSHRRAGLVVSFVVLGTLLLVQFAEQSLAYPFLRDNLQFFEFSRFPQIIDCELRAIDLSFGLFLVALSEELVFRRFLFALLERWGADEMTVILTSSVAFAFIHLTSGVSVALNAFVYGALFGLAFWITRRVSICIACHYLADFYISAIGT
jgi:membrane protease YdiL (CAAX protease family)